MKIDEQNIRAAYEVADENTRNVLRNLFPEILGNSEPRDDRPVTERVKTFGDAVRELGGEHPFVAEWNAYKQSEACSKTGNDLAAYLQLRIITAALNEGWEPEFSDDEYRYYPWFALYTKDELSDKSEEWKSGHAIRSCENHKVRFGGSASYGANAGFVCANAYYSATYATAHFGSRLCLKSEALARYAGMQFIYLWMDFNLIKK